MLYACRSRRYVVQMFVIYRPTALYMKYATTDLGNGQKTNFVSKYRGGSLHITLPQHTSACVSIFDHRSKASTNALFYRPNFNLTLLVFMLSPISF